MTRSTIALALVLLSGCSHGSRSHALPPIAPGPALDGVDRTRDPSCALRWAAGVVGRVVDESERPVPDIVGQACILAASGRRVCLVPSETSVDGVFTVVVPPELRCADEIALRVFDRSGATATVYALAPDPARDGVVYASRDLVMFALERAALPDIGDGSARTIALPGDVALTVAPDALDTYASLGARVLTSDEIALAGLGDDAALDTVLALGPEQPVRDAAASLRAPTSLPPGTNAEIVVLGGLYTTRPDGTSVTEAVWERLATSRVDADGHVSCGGLSALGWIGVRALE